MMRMTVRCTEETIARQTVPPTSLAAWSTSAPENSRPKIASGTLTAMRVATEVLQVLDGGGAQGDRDDDDDRRVDRPRRDPLPARGPIAVRRRGTRGLGRRRVAVAGQGPGAACRTRDRLSRHGAGGLHAVLRDRLSRHGRVRLRGHRAGRPLRRTLRIEPARSRICQGARRSRYKGCNSGVWLPRRSVNEPGNRARQRFGRCGWKGRRARSSQPETSAGAMRPTGTLMTVKMMNQTR